MAKSNLNIVKTDATDSFKAELREVGAQLNEVTSILGLAQQGDGFEEISSEDQMQFLANMHRQVLDASTALWRIIDRLQDAEVSHV